MRLFLLIPILFLLSCNDNKTAPDVFHNRDSTKLNYLVNQTNLESNPNIQNDIHLVNNDYPIEISLYKNNKFYYNLPNLGDGTGNWELKKDGIHLKAVRDILDKSIEMKYLIKALDEDAQNVSVEFEDRKGFRHLKLEKRNITNL